MARLGVFCPPWAGHLNPMSALGRELARRGHEVVFCTVPDGAEPIRRRGFEPLVYGEGRCPAGTLPERDRRMAELEGLAASRAGLDTLGILADVLFDEGRPAIEAGRLDLWLIDHLDYAASTLAAVTGAPFVTIVVGLMRHAEEGVPGFSGERYPMDEAGRERERRFTEAMLEATRPFRDLLGRRRREAGLSGFSYDTVWSPLAQITQQPEQLEFPRKELPACFHFAGPFLEKLAPAPGAFQHDSVLPLIYASFGTVQNRMPHLYEAVAAAAAAVDAQFVLSLGGGDPAVARRLAGANLTVLPFAPQREILVEADLAITHAGMNSTLECLASGTPMVAVPIAHDQHGVAARIERSGAGVRVPAAECDAVRLEAAVERVVGDPAFGAAARRFERIIAEGAGLARAADIVEQVLATGEPVSSSPAARAT